MDKSTMALLVLALCVTGAVFVGVSDFLQANKDTLPEPLLFVANFLSVGAPLAFIAIVRNVFGFAMAWAKSQFKEEYDASKLYTTLAMYCGLLTTLATMIPAPYGMYGALLLASVDIAYQTLKNVFNK